MVKNRVENTPIYVFFFCILTPRVCDTHSENFFLRKQFDVVFFCTSAWPISCVWIVVDCIEFHVKTIEKIFGAKFLHFMPMMPIWTSVPDYFQHSIRIDKCTLSFASAPWGLFTI